MFSSILTDSFEFDDGVDHAALLAHLEDCLRGLHAREVRIVGNTVTFRGGLFHPLDNWSVLKPFEHGRIVVDSGNHQVRYYLSVRRLIWIATALCVLGGGATFVDSGYNFFFLIVWGLGWLALVGGNLMINLPRFEQFLRKAIDTSPMA